MEDCRLLLEKLAYFSVNNQKSTINIPS